MPAKPEASAAAWACRLAADALEEGGIGPGKAAAERAARRLKAVSAACMGRPWGGVAAELAGMKEKGIPSTSAYSGSNMPLPCASWPTGS